MNVYSNNFIGEQNGQGKKGAGVTIDRVTPMGYLTDSKNALNEILAFKRLACQRRGTLACCSVRE